MHASRIVSIISLAATAIGAAACPPPVSPSPAAPPPYTGGDTSGCGKKHILNGLPVPRTLASGGKSRRYLVHLPASYDAHRTYPVIMGFHGSSSIGFFMEADTGLDRQRPGQDKITVYPDGLGGAWAGASYSATTTDEDLQFVWDVLADMRRTFCVDSARVYATGISNGGGFVDLLACNSTVGGEFAAFAPVSGAFYGKADDEPASGRGRQHRLLQQGAGACRPARVPTPLLEFHGGSDHTVPYGGGPGDGGKLPSIPSWLAGWARRSGCDDPDHPHEQSLYNGDVHHLRWTCGGREGVVQHYKTDSQKHDWPSPWPNFSQLAAGDLPTHLDATALIHDFFFQYTRPAE